MDQPIHVGSFNKNPHIPFEEMAQKLTLASLGNKSFPQFYVVTVLILPLYSKRYECIALGYDSTKKP